MTGWQELDSDVQFGWRQSILVTELDKLALTVTAAHQLWV
jgi:hypothetical protein